MKLFDWANTLQFCFITLGILVGVFFSNNSIVDHSLAHSNLDFHSNMEHGYLEVAMDSIVPEIESIEVFKDVMSGFNLHFQTKNFNFTPNNASSKHVPGKGHAHLMINGNKVARVYSNWFHIPELHYEIEEIEISLNSNSHEILSLNGIPISKKWGNHESGLKPPITMCKKM